MLVMLMMLRCIPVRRLVHVRLVWWNGTRDVGPVRSLNNLLLLSKLTLTMSTSCAVINMVERGLRCLTGLWKSRIIHNDIGITTVWPDDKLRRVCHAV